MDLFFSFIIPVYNRPEEIRELMGSLLQQTYKKSYEIVVVEDGSDQSAEEVVREFKEKLFITYLKKKNTGPGDSRNYGMQRAKGNYYIILDSDCIVPPRYLEAVEASLQLGYVDCYGGPDTAHDSFSTIQKAINYTMTSFLTTGGIRGNKKTVDTFQPRSFNMGLSKKAFESTGGFGNIHPGEDPDLSMRLWKKGYPTKLIPEAFVYHKRRIDFGKFYTQVKKFGMVRPILNNWHRKTAKITYWFPTLFCVGFFASIILMVYGIRVPILMFAFYFALIFFDTLLKSKSLSVAFLSMISVSIQFAGYGYGFLKSTILINFSKRKPQELFPELFF